MKFFYVCLIATCCLYAHGGGGGGGGGGHGGGGRGGGGGGHGYREQGQWENHAQYNGTAYGSWKENHWHGSYYYHGRGWRYNGIYFVGFSFYDCPVAYISNTRIWEVYPGDIATYEGWGNYDDITIQQAYYDMDYPCRLCNGTSCVRVRRART